MLPGSQVRAETVLLEMSNPQVEQAALDAQLQLKAAEAEYQSLRVRLDSDLMNQRRERLPSQPTTGKRNSSLKRIRRFTTWA